MHRQFAPVSAALLGLSLITLSCVNMRNLVGKQDDAATPGPALENWDRLSNPEFEALALAALPENRTTPLDEFLLAELDGALQDPGPRAVRAAVLLGRSGTRAASEILLSRLERRVLGEARNADAADVVAAGALERNPDADWARGRLAVLGAGPDPHPDLEVRVACAAAALIHGKDEVIPFLLQVLLIGVPNQSSDQRDFAVSDTTTWARSEAALALERRANRSHRYAADGPLSQRVEVAQALERDLLGHDGLSPSPQD